jgi:hypothetical protein
MCGVALTPAAPPGEVPLSSSPVPAPLTPILPHKLPSKLSPAPSRLETRALGTLVGAPTDESLESPTYTSCPKTIEFQAQVQRLVSYIGSVQHPICAYQADGDRQPLVKTFLRGGLASPRLDGDAVVGASTTCWISGIGVRPTFPPLVPMEGSCSPSWSEVTFVGRSCLDVPVGGPPSARGCFSRHSPDIDLICRGTTSRCGEGVVRDGGGGGEVRQERQSCPAFHFPLTGGHRSRGALRPPPFHHPSGGM